MIKKIIALLCILSCTHVLAMDDQQNTQPKQVAYFFKREANYWGIASLFFNKNREQITWISSSGDRDKLPTLKEHAEMCNIILAEEIKEDSTLDGKYRTLRPHLSGDNE